jgi:hypothetical protein
MLLNIAFAASFPILDDVGVADRPDSTSTKRVATCFSSAAPWSFAMVVVAA